MISGAKIKTKIDQAGRFHQGGILTKVTRGTQCFLRDIFPPMLAWLPFPAGLPGLSSFLRVKAHRLYEPE